MAVGGGKCAAWIVQWGSVVAAGTDCGTEESDMMTVMLPLRNYNSHACGTWASLHEDQPKSWRRAGVQAGRANATHVTCQVLKTAMSGSAVLAVLDLSAPSALQVPQRGATLQKMDIAEVEGGVQARVGGGRAWAIVMLVIAAFAGLLAGAMRADRWLMLRLEQTVRAKGLKGRKAARALDYLLVKSEIKGRIALAAAGGIGARWTARR